MFLFTALFCFADDLLIDAPAPAKFKMRFGTKSQRFVRINPSVAGTLTTPGSQFTLTTANGQQFTLQVNKVRTFPANTNSFTIECSVHGQPASYMILARENGAFAASFHRKDGELFQIGNTGADLHYIAEADPNVPIVCGVQGKTPPTPVFNTVGVASSAVPVTQPSVSTKAFANVTNSKPILDVVVVYTATALNDAGSPDAINSEIKLAMAEGQFALDNSQINVQLRLVHTEMTSYTETGVYLTDLTRLATPGDGFMDDALATRDKYKADILSLWVDQQGPGGLSGLAFQLVPNGTIYTYNVIARVVATGHYIPIHEIGHNFGCDHEFGQSQSSLLFPYCHGYIFQSPDLQTHSTIMTAAANQTRIPYFCNTNLTYDNGSGPVPLGTSTNNNALVMNNTAAKLTSFRVPPSLGEAVDAPTINWTTGGDNKWFWEPGFSHDGSDAAQSAPIGDNQSTYLQGTVHGPASLKYWRFLDSEPGGDFLTFSSDGGDQWSDSGGGVWLQELFFIPSGTHTVKWTYSKNGSISLGQDAAWIDQVQVQPMKLPTVAITSPAPGARLFSANTNVTGIAHDDVEIESVEYQLQNSTGSTGWQTASGGANWSVPITMTPGTNTITVHTVGFGGQVSAPVSRSFFYVVTNQLTVITNGLGKFVPSLNGKFLEIGRRYTITAVPTNNWLFSNWSGTISSNSAVLNFLMQSNMILQGNFVTNPFIPVAGVYSGLFREADAVREGSAGFITLTLARTGSFLGKMNLDGGAFAFVGHFDLNGNSVVTIPRARTNSVTIEMALQFGGDAIEGGVTNASWSAGLGLGRNVFDPIKNKATEFAGKYTVAIAGNADATVAPGGDSVVTVTVDNGGIVHATGTLADGTPFSQTVNIDKFGDWPLFAQLYLNRGLIFANAFFSTGTVNSSGPVTWIKPPMHTAFYSNGFTLNSPLTGSAFVTPSNSVRLLNFTNGTLTLRGANLPFDITNSVVLNSNNTVTVTGTNGVVVILNKLTGALTGSRFLDPVKRVLTPINGVILQNQNEARGYFRGTNQSGSVLLQGN